MKKQEEQKIATVSRRKFLGTLAGASVATVALAGCAQVPVTSGTGWVPTQYRNAGTWPLHVKGRVPLDPDNVAVVRNDEKCILCGQCVEACQNIESVFGYYELPVHDEFICVHCGQCSLWCPTGAIQERSEIEILQAAIDDETKTVVAAPSPATRVGVGEEFGMEPGAWAEGQMFATFKALGIDKCLDINFTADMTIMEEGSELVHRIKTGGVLPQFTSCCPGWVKFVEYFYPDLLPHVSSAKSPIQMHGPVVKTYYADKIGVDPKNIFNVAVTPCTAKKFEARRPEFNSAGHYINNDDAMRDIDCVITSREVGIMAKAKGVDLAALDPNTKPDPIMGEGSGAGLIFGNTGGVMEAAVRSAYFLLTGTNPPEALYNLTPVRGLEGIKTAALEIPGVGTVKVAVVHGLANARILCDKIRAGEMKDYAFIEVMTCPGGCISGGGQPRTTVPPQDWVREARIKSMYDKDASYKLRLSHENVELNTMYKEFIPAGPLSELAEELLHSEEHPDRSSSLTAKKTV